MSYKSHIYAVFAVLEIWPKLCQCEDLYKKIVMNAPCYSLVLIEYYGYFMQEEINMFLSIFINDSCKHISAHDKVNNNQEK